MVKKISLSTPHMSDKGYEIQFVEEAFRTNWIAPLGPMVDAFEQEIIQYTKSKFAVALSSGTAAIHLSLKALGIRKDDVIFCQSLTFSATANPILYENAIPVFIDSELETWNMSPKYLEEAFKKYPKVKAVIVVHLYGIPANLDQIVFLCNKYNVPLIEDAAESLGSTYKGKHTGTFGKFGVLSFNGNKIITTSGGGMVISEDKAAIEKIRFWATQSRDKARHYEHSELGYNYRMSNIAAAIGRGQLKVLDQRVNQKREIFDLYTRGLSQFSSIKLMPAYNKDSFSNCWLSSMTLDLENKIIPLIEYLELFNIESRPLWKPMHLQPLFKKYDFIGGKNSDRLFYHGICLPSDTKLTTKEVLYVIVKIQNFLSL